MVAEKHGFATYAEFRPSPFDGHICLEDREHWAVMPVGQNRDSELLSRSNFACFLEGLGGESETVEVHRFGHWANGWFEIIIVDPADEKAMHAAYDMAGSLQDYPILNEEHHSELETEECFELWEQVYDWRDRLRVFRRMSWTGDFHDLMEAIRGDWCAASNLLHYPSDILY